MTRSPAAPDLRLAEPGDRRYSLRETAALLEVPEARLRALARAGLLAPQRGPLGPLTFGFEDLLLLRTTRALLESEVPMRRIRRIWASLRDQLAPGLPLTRITIQTDGEQVVASDGHARWRPDSGQFLIDFDAAELAERAETTAATPRTIEPSPSRIRRAAMKLVVEPRERRDTRDTSVDTDDDATADAWYEHALELEGVDPAAAVHAYQHALALDPAMADAHVNLGRLHHLAGERGQAEAHYRDAVRLAPDDPTPHFNLGVLLEEQRRRDEAVHAYAQAIARDPEFADAHCNLGLLLESLGRAQDAMRHLMTARDLYRSSH